MGPEIFAEPTGNTAGIDADALMSQVESGGQVTPQGSPDGALEGAAHGASPKPPADAAQPTAQEIEFIWNGKQVKVPMTDPRVRQWAAQGYDYAQKQQMLKQEMQTLEEQKKLFEQQYSPYKQIDEYIQSNPEWWQHVQAQYEAAQAQAQAGGAKAGERDEQAALAELEKHPVIQQFKEFMAQQQAEKESQQRAEQDKQLTGEIQSIRDQFKDLDWDSPDQDGYSLESRVLKHAVDNGIKSFRAAFRDYNHEHLMKLAEERAKEQVVKDAQKRTKLGLLGQTQAPLKTISPAEDVKNKSWDQLLKEGLEELQTSAG